MSALKLSSKAPDKPGWWWVRYPDGRKEIVMVAKAAWLGGRLFALGLGEAPPVDTMTGCQWAGPIPEPEELEQ